LTPSSNSYRFNGITTFTPPSAGDFTSRCAEFVGVFQGIGPTSGFAAAGGGYAYQTPSSNVWFRTNLASGNGILQINRMSNASPTASGLVYDTVFNPLPTYPNNYIIGKNVVQNTFYAVANQYQRIINTVPSFSTISSESLLTFKLRPSASLLGNGFAGIAPIGNTDFTSSILCSVGAFNGVTNLYQAFSVYINSPPGTYYDFIFNFPNIGTVAVTELSLKSLPS